MADAQVLYDEDVAATTAATTTWVSLASIPAASFTANKRYLILANQVVKITSAANEARIRLVHGSTPTQFTDAYAAWEGLNATQEHEDSFLVDFTQPGTTEDVTLQISTSATNTVTNILSQIMAIKLDDDFTSGTDYFIAEDLVDYTMTATPTAKATTASFTPNGTDRWLYIGAQIADVVGITTQIGFELYDSVAGVLNKTSHEGEDGTNDFHGQIQYWAGVPTNAARTLAVRPFDSGAAIMLQSRVIAINLAKFAQSAHAFDATEVDPASSPTYTTLATVAPTPDVTGDWVYIAFSNQDVNEATTDWETRLQVNPSGGGLVDDPAYASTAPSIDQWDVTDEGQFSVFKKRSLTSGAARTINWDARQVAGTTGRMEDNGLVAFSIALAGGGSSVSRTTTDAVTYADSAIRVVVLLRTTSDAVAHADVATRAVTLIRSVSDAIGLADAATQIKTILRSVSDAVGFSDAATRAGTFLRTATDAVTHSDAATRALALLRSATDAATYADAATQVRAIVRSASDAVGLSDAATRVGSFLRTAADSFSLSDVVEAIIGGAVTIGQAVLSFPLIYHATRIFDVIHAALFSLPIVHKATLASMALEYDLNDTVSPTCTFTVSDVNTDPTTISLTVREPDGTTTTYTYAGATVTKSSTGVYTKNITLAKRGVWLFQWAGTGACQASAEGTVTVRY